MKPSKGAKRTRLFREQQASSEKRKKTQPTGTKRPRVDRTIDSSRDSPPPPTAEEMETEQLWEEFDHCQDIVRREEEDERPILNEAEYERPDDDLDACCWDGYDKRLFEGLGVLCRHCYRPMRRPSRL